MSKDIIPSLAPLLQAAAISIPAAVQTVAAIWRILLNLFRIDVFLQQFTRAVYDRPGIFGILPDMNNYPRPVDLKSCSFFVHIGENFKKIR
jgi:hypothetical protein